MKRIAFFLVLTTVLFGCSEEEVVSSIDSSDLISSLDIRLNPTGVAPLTAKLDLSTTENVVVELKIVGKNGEASTIVKRFTELANSFELDVLGLYADYLNKLELILLDQNGTQLESHDLTIQTQAILEDLPEILIDKEAAVSEPEFNLVNYFGFKDNFRPQRPFIFDQFGDIRWYLDYSGHSQLSNLFYDNGLTQLRNGNLLFGDGSTGAIYEVNMLGEIIDSWSLQGYGFHHHVIEKPNGNFLVTVNDPNKATVEDVIIEIDRTSGQIITVWDLNYSLDNTRRAWPTDLADLNIDWFHANAIEYSTTDNEIIVSGRTQGIVKLNNQNEVSYILAPHKDWGTAGNGQDLSQFLLTPLDNQDLPISDDDVLLGNSNHPDFEWPWYQHSPILLPNGNIMIFDNGDNRNYVNFGPYSRAVEYEIDEINKTIKQVWSYGKNRGQETYSRIVSKVSYIPGKESILFTPGASVPNGTAGGKVVEVDYTTKDVLFEATITPPNNVFNITFHNVLRVSVYP